MPRGYGVTTIPKGIFVFPSKAEVRGTFVRVHRENEGSRVGDKAVIAGANGAKCKSFPD